MQDLGMCEGGEGDPCEGFNMADVDLSFDNYADIFSSTQGPSTSSFDEIGVRCPSMGQDAAGNNEHGRMQSIPEAELFNAINVHFWHFFQMFCPPVFGLILQSFNVVTSIAFGHTSCISRGDAYFPSRLVIELTISGLHWI